MTQKNNDQFSSFSRICSFWTKFGPLSVWHTVSVYFNFQNSNWSAIFNFPFFWTPFFGFRHTKWLLVKENNENRSDIAFWKILTRNMDQYSLPTKNSQDINNKSMVENYQFFDKTRLIVYYLLSFDTIFGFSHTNWSCHVSTNSHGK